MNYTFEEITTKDNIQLLNYLPNIGIDNVKNDIYKGLFADSKYILPKYFYDAKGSELFEQITHLDEYYPARTEKSIISKIVKNLDIDFRNLNVVELGSGDSSKISLLLQQISDEILQTINYFPVDISRSAIEKSIAELKNQFNLNKITGVIADFIHQLNKIPKQGKRLFCFFGSTIGNLNTQEVKDFITLLGKQMEKGDCLLLGLDMVKDINVLTNAYNDKKGVTAKFNKNILHVINNLIDSDFNTSDFEHYAFFNTQEYRIEMHLRALRNVEVSFSSFKEKIEIQKGEAIHTENSNKFTPQKIEIIGELGNLNVRKVFTDDNKWFSLVHYQKA